MRNLKENYKKNIEVLKENIKRGMTLSECNQVIDSQRNQFARANLLDQDAINYLDAMREVIDASFMTLSELAKKQGIEIINN